ncbi:hypothetical protein DXG01_016584 [Tephrocybe rancida]|nr:hypothetical protein DXG01_016584 [Tephrocybe rancida]
MLDSPRPGLGISKAALGIVYASFAEGFLATGEYLCVPDLSSLRLCPYSPKHASVMVWLKEKKPYLTFDNKLTVDVPLCPRATLHRIVSKADSAGVHFLVGFETEFILLKSTRPVEPLGEHNTMDSKALLAGSVEDKILEEISDGIQASVTALCMPLPASYQRMVDGIWSGGTYVNWGTENREAPIRLTNASSPSSRNFEVKCVDGTANPYLALAAILGVGFDGIERDVELTVRNCSGPVTAAEMTEDGRKSLGITTRMPLTWTEACDSLKANKLLTEHVLGPELTETYLVVNKVCNLSD